MPNIIEITDFEAPELDVYARLSEHHRKKDFSSPKVQRLLNAPWTQAVSRYLFCLNENTLKDRPAMLSPDVETSQSILLNLKF